jgi:hypothetical protein
MKKREILSKTHFGQRIAEEESDQLYEYFVETDQWKSIAAGEVDIVYGAKGSGKSAIYSLLLSREVQLERHGIHAIPAENPKGSAVFEDLAKHFPVSEDEFRALWKLYVLCLVGTYLRSCANSNKLAEDVVRTLEDAELLLREDNLKGMLLSALHRVRQITKVESVSGGLEFNPATGLPVGLTGKITFREPDPSGTKVGLISTDELIKKADSALGVMGKKVWVLVDRLDVAFAEKEDLETRALRALFRAYSDLRPVRNISLKLFLRTDIWNRITSEGFREASHISRHTTITWNRVALVNLIARRLMHNQVITSYFTINPFDVLADSKKQYALVARMFPAKMDAVPDDTMEWIMSRLHDGSELIMPRELIHFLICAREIQLKRLEVGAGEPNGDVLFDPKILKQAMREVSKTRFEQTLCAEYPKWKKRMQSLRGQKPQHSVRDLATIWNETDEKALSIAESLSDIGFFERPKSVKDPVFTVPFLYRPALNIT